jgi:hypothetical protein
MTQFMRPDDNDVLYNEYGVDLLGIFEYLLEGILGIGITLGSIGDFLSTAWEIFSLISFLVSLLFIIGIIYAYLRINEYAGLINERIELAEIAWKEAHGPKTDNDRWSEVLRHVGSDRPNDWKLAIIEADIMLGEGLKERGYAGISIGDQLKGLAPSQFTSLQDAWDAHRIRNRIAHEGSDFVLTQNAAREAIVKYERSLRELGVI